MINQYIPILKTKRQVEFSVLKNTLPLLGKAITPYLEVLPSSLVEGRGASLSTYLDLLNSTPYFLQYYKNPKEGLSFEEYTAKTIQLSKRCKGKTISLYISKPIDAITIQKIKQFIDEIHKSGNNAGIRISDWDDGIRDFLNDLGYNDYLFLDFKTNRVNSMIMLWPDLSSVQCRKVYFSQELNTRLSNQSYNQFGYNKEIINNSQLKYFSDTAFGSFAIGNYCGIKNDANQSRGSNKAFALLLIFSTEENDFFSIRSSVAYSGAHGFSEVLQTIRQNEETISPLFSLCPLSSDLLKKRLDSPKDGIFQYYHAITITNYIEKMYNLIMRQNKV